MQHVRSCSRFQVRLQSKQRWWEETDSSHQQTDYKPVVDFVKWGRRDVHRPKDEDNKLRGWSYKANVGGNVEVRFLPLSLPSSSLCAFPALTCLIRLHCR
jgi:hypothetical protein